MGKNKNKNKKDKQEVAGATQQNQKKAEAHVQTTESGCGSDVPIDQQTPEPVEEVEVKTAEERVQEYRDQTAKVHKKFIEQFEQEIALIMNEDHIEERKQEQLSQVEPELQKLEKVTKKMMSDMEKITGAGATNFKRVRDKIMGELFENIKKANQMLTKSNIQRMDYQEQISDYKKRI